MTMIIFASQDRQVLVARPQTLEQPQSTVTRIFDKNGQYFRTSIIYTDPRGTMNLVELHTSSYHMAKPGTARAATIQQSTIKSKSDPSQTRVWLQRRLHRQPVSFRALSSLL